MNGTCRNAAKETYIQSINGARFDFLIREQTGKLKKGTCREIREERDEEEEENICAFFEFLSVNVLAYFEVIKYFNYL